MCTGYHISKYNDGLTYSSEEGKFWDASGGGTMELSEDQVETDAESPGPYRICGPTVSNEPFVDAIKRKINDRNKLIDKFQNSREDEEEMRQVMINTIQSLALNDHNKFLDLLSETESVSLNGNMMITVNGSKELIAKDIDYPTSNTANFILNAKAELSNDIYGKFTAYVNDFVNQDINVYAQLFPGCTVITCSDRWNYPEIVWVLHKEESGYKIVSFYYYLTDGE